MGGIGNVQKVFLLLFVLANSHCNSQVDTSADIQQDVIVIEEAKPAIHLSDYKLDSDDNLSYKGIKASIKANKLKAGADLDSLSKVFTESLLHRIIPQWAGTTWSFEGHTAVPQQGEIACGYFVSTTLRDVGVNLNRYTLAQQLPINEAKSLKLESEIIEISNDNISTRIAQIQDTLNNGLHFIGFGAGHVGYILKEDSNLYIIHSNYMGNGVVEIERAEESDVFGYFTECHIVELSTNKSLLKAWAEGKEIIVVKE